MESFQWVTAGWMDGGVGIECFCSDLRGCLISGTLATLASTSAVLTHDLAST